MTPEKMLQNAATATGKENQLKLERVVSRKQKLEAAIEEMAQDGNWNHDPYMLGLYNGLVYAKALLENQTPIYKDIPENGFQINDPTIRARLLAEKQEMDLVRSERQSKEFANKILEGGK